MKKTFLLMSDTHGIINIENEVKAFLECNNISYIDYFIHSGDKNAVNPYEIHTVNNILDREKEQVNNIKEYFGNIIQTVGNHEAILCPHSLVSKTLQLESSSFIKKFSKNFILKPKAFNDNELSFFVTPTSPKFGTVWGFFEENWNDELVHIYQNTEKIDVIVSHSPPKGYGDVTDGGESVGSEIIEAFINKYEPKLLVCGHIHEARGIYKHKNGKTIIVNASSITSSDTRNGDPIYIEIEF